MPTLRLVLSLAALALPSLSVAQDQPGGPGSGQGQGGGRRGPPPEALAACQGKSAGASCSWSHDGRALEGTCFTPASDKPLACRPSGAPPPDQQR
jgi:hypothetical protein